MSGDYAESGLGVMRSGGALGFDIDMQACPHCGTGELKIIAVILEQPVIEKILGHLGLDPQPPPRDRVREVGQAWAH